MHVSTNIPTRFIGCDVGKAEIVIFDSRTGHTTKISNTGAALARFAASLDPDGLVICEATGGYEAALLDALVTAGRPVHRADARKVKAFIRSLGTLGKSDAIDACALARYGSERHDRLARWQPRDHQRDRLHLLVTARRELVRERVAYRNRLQAPGMAPIEPASAASSQRSTPKSPASTPISIPSSRLATRYTRPSPSCAPSPASDPPLPPSSPPSCPNSVPSDDARPPPSPASLPIPGKAAPKTPIAEPAVDGPRSNTPCSWPPSPPPATILPCATSTSASKATAKNPSSPSSPSCAKSSSSLTLASATLN